MKADLSGDCFRCEQADLQTADLELTGTVRGESYTVRMRGLTCPNCGYQTLEGTDTPELGRLLSDAYRAAHGLLTSVEIRARRDALQMNQVQFALYLGVGPASVKRWELGKIQDQRNDDLIRRKTGHKILTFDTQECTFAISGSTSQPFGLGSATFVPAFIANEPAGSAVRVYIADIAGQCANCKETARDLSASLADTISPHLADLIMRGIHAQR